MRVLGIVVVALLGLAFPDAADSRDPAYWATRMEQALLPKASLRAGFVLETHERGLPVRRIHAGLTRLQGPERIRSVVTVEGPVGERRIVKATSTPDGSVEQEVYTGGPPVAIRVDRHEPVLGSALSWADLGFVEVAPIFREAELGFEDTLEGRRVRLETGPDGPYGKVVAHLDPETALPRRVEYYDRRDPTRLVRTVSYGQVRRKHLFHLPLEITARQVRSGTRSTLRFEDVELGPEIYEYEFSQAHLQRTLREILERPAFG